MPTPLARYQSDLLREGFSEDPAQAAAINVLEALHAELLQHGAGARGSWWRSAIDRLRGRDSDLKSVQGLYMWGGVGRGKTYMMDLFFETLPFEKKMRSHFHRFMRRVHAELKEFAGEKNPLVQVADKIAAETRIICFDEFFVSDITDAMILAGLFERLFDRGVLLVATSNIPPPELYKDGLQRQRFLPAIALIEANCRVMNVDGGTDYRLRTLKQAELWHSPLDAGADISLRQSFESLAPEESSADQQLEIEGRTLLARHLADDVAWFDFSELCDGPRSQNDYIELAREFHAIVLSNVPVMDASKDDQARRFINLVDEFYDRNVKMVISAAAPLGQLYSGGRLAFEFQRTDSRLLEMQSHEYLARQHRP